MHRHSIFILAVALLGATACRSRDAESRAARAAASNAVPATVDSALPRDEELRRFRVGLAPSSDLANGERTLDAVALRVGAALEARDTTALTRLLIDKSEFAYLYYPSSPIGQPPYDLSPGLMWFQNRGNSARGLNHVLTERGGHRLAVLGVRCDAPKVEGENRIHGNCRVRRLRARGDTLVEPFFGAVIERSGRFKVLSYSNRL